MKDKAELGSSSGRTKLMPSGYKAELGSSSGRTKLMPSGYKAELGSSSGRTDKRGNETSDKRGNETSDKRGNETSRLMHPKGISCGAPSGYKNAIGLICCVLLFSAGFMFNGSLALYFNIAGALVVFGGTFGATLMTFRVERLKIVYKVLISSYKTRTKTPEEIVEILVDLSVKSKFVGLLSLQEDEEETTILFLRRALGLLVDGYKGPVIRDILNTEMYFFKMRREDCERVIRTMAELFPSFGLVGSVVGLIGMLSGVGDSRVIMSTVPIALTSTLYGVVLSNFFCVPFAGNIRERTDQELLLQKIIMEGVIAIESEMDPRSLERKLHSFVTPSSRNVQLVSLKRIQERFNLRPRPKI